MSTGTIKKVAGPLVIAEGMRDANMFDVVRVSSQRLIGEIIEIHGDEASIQVYEETSGLGPGEPVESMGVPMSVELGPGLITSIYDGIQRPLDDIMKISGNNLKRGVEVPSLKRNLKWEFVPTVKVGDEVETGDVIGTVQETVLVQQKIMVPYGIKGTIKEIKEGTFTVEDIVAVVETEKGEKELTMMQKWPVRRGRPYKKKLPPEMPLVTGQRVVDTFFPISHLLDFVEEQINLAADFFCSAKDFIMQCNSRTKVCIAHVLKIQGNKLFWLDPVLGKFLLDQAQHDRFSTTANPCQNLYQLISDKRTDTAHINFSFNHVDQPPF